MGLCVCVWECVRHNGRAVKSHCEFFLQGANVSQFRLQYACRVLHMRMPTKRKSPPKRDEAQTTLTISLPKEMKDEIEKAAKEDRRSISNYLVMEIAKMLKKQ